MLLLHDHVIKSYPTHVDNVPLTLPDHFYIVFNHLMDGRFLIHNEFFIKKKVSQSSEVSTSTLLKIAELSDGQVWNRI